MDSSGTEPLFRKSVPDLELNTDSMICPLMVTKKLLDIRAASLFISSIGSADFCRLVGLG